MKPYSEAQWRAIDGLGRRVDADLESGGARLTQGGEPTFVSATGGDALEWNYSAHGDDKRRLAARLLRRLHARFAPRGLMHFGQGKWYPGEALPRWALALFWRRDGAPLWREPRLIADEENGATHGTEDARRVIEALAARLGIAADYVLPAHEDPWPALEAESRLPAGYDPLRNDLGDAGERARLARLLRQGLTAVAGYVLPLSAARRAGDKTVAWRSSRWPLRREPLCLVPGDSPIGYRLPLDALPDDGTIARTALCVETRGGHVHVFVPPLDSFDDYVALVAVIEHCTRDLGIAVLPEGYEPPPDPSVTVLKVTPDPGVIEINVQPAADWTSLTSIFAAVYEEARALGLIAEKFLRDGRRCGTGGGSHITLGGSTPADSPLLRRPDLLISFLTYWQNHPSLSYLFSGQYVGPTSQAPRVDEAREDSLYELEIAFQQLQQLQQSGTPAPEQVDRLLRNLLVDVTGNTHRAEFCIDKLYSPDGPAGRLGLLELRAFEMAPHEQMAAAQFLLVRALFARFWKTPYRGRLIPWGSALRDRFLLPQAIADDIREVLADLEMAGYAYEYDWLAPFFEFRFPIYGTVDCGGVTLELRHALEPWPVLGEAATSGGVSRAVDASMERVQVKATGLQEGRHVMLCNGQRLPLHPAGGTSERFAGVRFRARLFPNMLHPTIGLQSPLVFEIVDTDSGRSIGGCAYHASAPSGQAYDSLPANAAVADARRQARFRVLAPGDKPVQLPPASRGENAPYTFDLRYGAVARS